MAGEHPEKRSFLHSTSDTDSDIENELGWGDVRLANQVGSRSFAAPKHSYVTHDFNVFRAAKPDPDGKDAVSESKFLQNVELGDEREADGSPIGASVPSNQGSSSMSGYRPQESTSLSEVSPNDTYGGEAGGRDSYIGSGIRRSSFQKSPIIDNRQLVTGTISTGIDCGGRTSYSGDSERQPSGRSVFNEIDTWGQDDGGRNSLVGSDRPSIAKSLLSDIHPLAEKVKSSLITRGNERQTPAQSRSEIDLLGEEIERGDRYVDNSSERQQSLHPSVQEIETHGEEGGGMTSHTGNERWSVSYLKSPGDEGGGSIYVGNGSDGRPSTTSKFVDFDIKKEDIDGGSSYVSSGERFASGKKPILDEVLPQPLKEIRRASVNSGRHASLLSPVSDNDVHGDEAGEGNTYLGIGNERRPSGKERVLDEQSEPLMEIQRASVISGRRVSRLPSTPDMDKDPELPSERVRVRGGSVGQSNRRMSRVVSPTPEAESNVQTRARDEYGEVVTADVTALQTSLQRRNSLAAQVGERVPPEWALLLLGCLLGLTTGLSVVLFNKGVHFIHDMAWAGTPKDGAAWFRLQQLIDIWHRVMLIPVVGGVVVGMMHAVLGILDQGKASTPPAPRHTIDWLAGVKPTVKATQAMVTLGTGCSLGPEGPSVDIGKAWAHGLATIMKNNRERRIALVAAGAAAGISAGLHVFITALVLLLKQNDVEKADPHGRLFEMQTFYNLVTNEIEMHFPESNNLSMISNRFHGNCYAGFNAPVSGMFFAIETVLRPQNAENSPPLTTAMIILASVISSTVSQVLLEETQAFTVPTYELRSAAELPLYLLLGGVCGVVSVIMIRMTLYFTEVFEFLRDRIGIPPTVTPAIGGLVTGLIALKYPGVLYWGFTNVDEILHSGKSATAPGAGWITQLICAKVVATAFSKGSGLVGGVYAPSLFIGAAIGSVYGTIAGKIINAALPGQETVAHPQAYALVGMAALLAAVCSVPLTSILLLFELTKDYHILLPLMGGIGVAIWVAAVAKQTTEKHFAAASYQPGRSLQPLVTDEDGVPAHSSHRQLVWRRTGSGTDVECCTLDYYEGSDVVSDAELKESIKVSQAMSKSFVKVQAIATVKETIGQILLKQQRCAIVVDENDLLEGIFTFSDLKSEVMRAAESSHRGHRTVVNVDKMLIAAICSGKGDNRGQDTDLVVCFPDMSLSAVLEIMDSAGFKQLPVVARAGKRWQDEGRQIIGLIGLDAIPRCIKVEASKRIAAILAKNEEDDDAPLLDSH